MRRAKTYVAGRRCSRPRASSNVASMRCVSSFFPIYYVLSLGAAVFVSSMCMLS